MRCHREVKYKQQNTLESCVDSCLLVRVSLNGLRTLLLQFDDAHETQQLDDLVHAA